MKESHIYDIVYANTLGSITVQDDADVIRMIMKANLNGFIEGLADSDEETAKRREEMDRIVTAVKAYLETR